MVWVTAAVTDWAALAAAGFAAVAAAASWASVVQSQRAWRASQRPALELTVLRGLDTGSIRIHIENHGQGNARRVRFCVVEGSEVAYGNLPPNGLLRAGEGRTLGTPWVSGPNEESFGVVFCTDARQYVHAWALGGQHKQWSLRWPWNRKLSDEKVFRAFYPSMGHPIEGRDFARYEVLPQ